MANTVFTNKRAFEKRGRGRPKKDEVVARPLTVHNFAIIKPEKRMAYVKETIKTANALYARYKQSYPNPLNIDDKDLEPSARACWDFIYSQRGYEGIPDDHTAGRKRAITTEECLYAFECYISWIRDNNFTRGFKRPDGTHGMMPIVPNQSNFAKWLGVGYRAIGAAIADDEQARNTYKNMLADCLSEGAMVGAYEKSSTIFSLKNLCDWADKYEDRSTSRADDLGVEEAQELMKQLGYSRKRATLESAPKPMLEGDIDG